MKFAKITFLIFSFLLLTNSLFAGSNTMIDDLLMVPRAASPPVIDGELDAVWMGTSNVLMEVAMPDIDQGIPDDWFDLWGCFRVMYDDDNIYLFCQAMDDIILFDEAGGNHTDDGVEFYFDADNSKTEGEYDGADDLQLRFNVHDDSELWRERDSRVGYGTGADWGFDRSGGFIEAVDTDLGYNIEISIPLIDLMYDPLPGSEYGFEVQLNDADETVGTRDHGWRWWNESNDSWKDASIFGTIALAEWVADSVLNFHMAPSAPEIDGDLDDIWLDMPAYSSNTYVTIERGEDPYQPRTDEDWDIFLWQDDWNDCRFDFRAMWDMDYLYFFIEARDDVIDIEDTRVWMIDGFEFYFDGDNTKNDFEAGVAYDANDSQQRIVYTADPTDDYAFMDTEWGYNLECRYAFETLGWVPEEDQLMGFDLQQNDSDEGLPDSRDTMQRWWSNNNNSWQDASLFGTVRLVGTGTEVARRTDAAPVSDYVLAQNYPNPFNPSTNITYALPANTQVVLTVYDMLGKEIATLVNEYQNAGSYTVTFSGADLTSGVYFYKLQASDRLLTQKMLLIK